MSLVDINWSPNKTDLRKFGLTMLVGFQILALVFYLKNHNIVSLFCVGFGVVFGIFGISANLVGLWFYKGWMAVAFVMGNIMSRVIIFIFYYLLLTPISVAFKIFNRDKLNLKPKIKNSYWENIDFVAEKRLNEHLY